MAPCKKYTDIEITRYVLGKLSQEEALNFQVHMMQCQYCYQQVTDMRNIADRLYENDHKDETKNKRSILIPLLSLTSAAAIAIVAFFAYDRLHQGNMPEIQNPQIPVFHNIDSVKTDSTNLDLSNEFEKIPSTVKEFEENESQPLR